MEETSKIYVAGHNGMVGSAITNCLREKGYSNLILRTLKELDLANQKSVDEFFNKEKPEYVFLAAALVGGIVANNTLRADFIYQNLIIQCNVIHAAWRNKVKKLLFLGSTCIYPKHAPQPLKEEYLLSSKLEFTNEPYAIAKIAGLKMCESFNIQYKTNYISVMPTNLYGPGDNFNLEKSHVLPALLRKIHLGKCLEDQNWDALRRDLDKNPIETVDGKKVKELILEVLNKYGINIVSKNNDNSSGYTLIDKNSGESNVTVNVWGTGTPLREFMYSLDMAEACVFIMEHVDIADIINLNDNFHLTELNPQHFINIGTGEEITIKDLAFKIKKMIGFKGEIVFDATKPDGTYRKITDTSSLKKLGYVHKLSLDRGLSETYTKYLADQNL